MLNKNITPPSKTISASKKGYLKTFYFKNILLSLGVVAATSTNASTVFINEFHYDNTGSDINEGVEIIGIAGTNLSNWSLQSYNGGSGTVYKTTSLDGSLSNQQNGYGVLSFAVSGLQNGPADALALVNNNNQLIEFISYEGTVLAQDGVAAGQTSVNVGVAQATNTDIGLSIQRIGAGSINSEFSWTLDNASFGSVNTGQILSAAVPLPAPALLFLSALTTLCFPRIKLKSSQ
jgi:hypothetical protein